MATFHQSHNLSAKVYALFLYFTSTSKLTTNSDASGLLTPDQIDRFIDGVNETIEASSENASLIAQRTQQGDDLNVGVVVESNGTGHSVRNTTKAEAVTTSVIAAAIFSDQSIKGIDFYTVFILKNSSAYQNLDESSREHAVVSAIITASARQYDSRHDVLIDLYFRVLQPTSEQRNGEYVCSFFNTSTSTWSESGCSKARYNDKHQLYKCTCDHQSIFALLWLSTSPLSDHLDAKDFVSLTVLSISCLAFSLVIIHSLMVRLSSPSKSIAARELLPLISTGSTTLLFILFIALSIRVYTRTSPSDRTQATLEINTLMFALYFSLIFMFATKTSVGYFNYLRFVRLFSEPSYQNLFVILFFSLLISIICTSLAIGFHTHSSNKIAQFYGNKFYWFTPKVLYYFLTIPVSLFLLVNLILIGLISRHILRSVRNAATPAHFYERRKRCVLVLLSSCLTQGIGWFLGPFLSIIHPNAAAILDWVFILFNGLEGLWTILLYIIIRSQAKG